MISRLRSLRLEKALTLQGLAAKTHSSPSTLVFIERYGHVPGPDLRQRIADALKVNEAELWPSPDAVNQAEGSQEQTQPQVPRSADR